MRVLIAVDYKEILTCRYAKRIVEYNLTKGAIRPDRLGLKIAVSFDVAVFLFAGAVNLGSDKINHHDKDN